MPRNPPPIAQPAITISHSYESAGPAPILFGGNPQLPEDVSWPRENGFPLHFFAQIDLGALPREMEQADQIFSMPDFPKSGTLFVFLPLYADAIFGGQATVIYANADVSSLPEREPPEDTPQMDPEYYMDMDHVVPGGTIIKRQYGSLKTYLSYRAENPLWRNMERPHSPQEVYERDLAYANQLKSLGIDYEAPLPDPEAVSEETFEKIPFWFQGSFQRGVFQWNWVYIFEFAKRAFAGCLELPVQVIEEHNDVLPPRYQRFVDKMKRQRREVLNEPLDGKSNWWQRFAGDHAPSTDIRLDVQFKRWMHYARQMHPAPMSDEDKWAFVKLLQKIDDEADEGKPLSLASLARVGHDLEVWDVYSICKEAFKDIAHSRKDLHPGRLAEPTWNFGDTDSRQLQMFGLGYLLQSAAVDHEDKVLLLQISDACGVNFGSFDMLVQLWIPPDDLAAGRFDRVITTLEMT
jgi:hypothetical protein